MWPDPKIPLQPRLFSEKDEGGAYREAMSVKVKAMGDGMRTYIEMLPEHLQLPMAEYLLTGSWPESGGEEK